MYGQPGLRVRRKLFAWMSPSEQGALCVRVDPDEEDAAARVNPDAYFTSPHYASYPAVLIRFEHIRREELADGSRTPGSFARRSASPIGSSKRRAPKP